MGALLAQRGRHLPRGPQQHSRRKHNCVLLGKRLSWTESSGFKGRCRREIEGETKRVRERKGKVALFGISQIKIFSFFLRNEPRKGLYN